jgi:hypothetical protein
MSCTTITQLSDNPTLVFAGGRATDIIKDAPQAMHVREREIVPPLPALTSIVDVVARNDDDVRIPAEATPLSIVLNWFRLGRAGLSDAAYSRLFAIAARPDGWRGRGSRALSATSLSVFLKFWGAVSHDATEPQFALLPNGNLSAEWFKNSRRHLDLEFADDWMIYCGLFNGDGIWEGKETVENIANVLRATVSKPLRWRSK